MKRRSSLTVLTLIIPVLLGVALFEVVCRVVDVDFNPNPNWRFHRLLGWSQEPAKVYDITIDGESVRIEFNRMGFRDVDHPIPKPRGTRRIVIIGDSFSEAAQVNLGETYFRRLQGLLNGRTSQRWEIINLGVGDFGTAQEWLALQHYGYQFDPDFVILEVYPLNDICNNCIDLAGVCKSQNDDYRPYLVPDGDELRLTWADPEREWLRTHLVSFGVLEKAWLLGWSRFRDLSPDELHRRRYTAMGLPGDPLLLTFASDADQPPVVARGWQTTESIIRGVDRELDAKGIRWMAFAIPFEWFVADHWTAFNRSHRRIPLIRDYAEARLGRLCERLGAPFLPLLPVFDQHPDIFFPSRGGHLNPPSHELVAEALLEKMEEAGWVGR
jgi:hypothetical protein